MNKNCDSNSLGDLKARIAQSGQGVIVDFTGARCAPCKLLLPILADLAEEYRGRLEVLTVDIEEHPDLAQRYGVRSVPTLVGFSGGEVRAQQVGFSNARRVRAMFAELAELS
jgi:thioredoxin 1